MKRIAFFVLCLSIVTICFAGSEPRSFRGISWGGDFKTVASEMELIKDDGDSKSYKRKNEKLLIDKIELTSITYIFYKDRFFAVMIFCKGGSNAEQLISIFDKKYGVGAQGDKYKPRDLIWEFPNIEITTKFLYGKNLFYIQYRHLPTLHIITKDKEKQYANTDDF